MDDNLYNTNSGLLASLEAGGYQLKKYAYPYDVGTNKNGHSIMFIINQTNNGGEGKSTTRAISNPNVPEQFQQTIPVRDQKGATSLESRQLAGTANRTRRASEVITLYMPEDITTVYGLDYEHTNMQKAATLGAGSFIDQMQHLSRGEFDQLSSQTTNLYTSLRNAGKQEASDAARVALSNMNEDVANALSANFRVAYNPHMEFLFRGVNLRTFSFDFIFTPRSEQEAANVYNIIKLFKVNSIPEVRDNLTGVFFKYPAEFDIVFMSHGQENKFLSRISTCACTSATVKYTGAGQNAMHKQIRLDDGSVGAPPTHTILSLQFTEMEIMSKQRMEEGF